MQELVTRAEAAALGAARGCGTSPIAVSGFEFLFIVVIVVMATPSQLHFVVPAGHAL